MYFSIVDFSTAPPQLVTSLHKNPFKFNSFKFHFDGDDDDDGYNFTEKIFTWDYKGLRFSLPHSLLTIEGQPDFTK